MIRMLLSYYNKLMVWKFRRYVLSQVKAGMHLGKNVMICPGVKFDPPHSFLTSIGDNCVLAPDVRFLNHDASLFLFAGIARIGRIDIKENCFIGAGSTLLPGITIGPDAIVGANSVVTKNVEPDTIVAGNPAKPLKKTSEYIALCKDEISSGVKHNYKSSEFYLSLSDPDNKSKINNEILNSIAFTIGGDEDYTFVFNR